MSESVNHDAAVPASALVIIGLISASILCFEILLTRICALRLYFHFGYFIVSVCLLGIGASGSLIAIFQQRWRARLQHWLFVFSMLYLISLILTYAFLISFPIPADLSFNDLDAVARFAAFAFAGAVPVFFGASVVGLILTVYAERVSVVYAADMLGAGAGCLLAPFLLWQFGAGGGIAAICVLILSAMVITVPSKNWGKLIIFLTVLVLIAVPRVDSRAPVPGKHYLELTDSEQVVFMEPEYSRWGPNSRIDVLTIPSHQRNLFARGSVDFETPLPEQKFIMQDGSAGTYISNFSDFPRGLEHVARSMYSIAVQLKQRPRVLARLHRFAVPDRGYSVFSCANSLFYREAAVETPL